MHVQYLIPKILKCLVYIIPRTTKRQAKNLERPYNQAK